MEALFQRVVHVRVALRPRRQEPRVLDLAAGATARDALAAAGQPASSTIVVRAGNPIPEATPLADGDELTLLSSFSGG